MSLLSSIVPALLVGLLARPESTAPGTAVASDEPRRAPDAPVLLQDPALGRVECTCCFRYGPAESIAGALLAELDAGASPPEGPLADRGDHVRLELLFAPDEAPDALSSRLANLAGREVEPAEFELARERLARRWAAARGTPESIAAGELERRTRGAGGARDDSDRLAELDALELGTFLEQRAAIFTRARLALGAAGSEPVGQLATRIEAALAALPEGAPAEPAATPPFLEPPRTIVHLVDAPQAVASLVRIAAPGTRRLAPDEAALALFTRSLLEGARAEALQAIADELELELTRPPGFRPEWGRNGRFELEFQSPHGSVADALAAITRWLREARAPLAPAELGALRDAIIAGPDHRPPDVRATLARALELRLHGYPDDSWEQRARHLRALEPAAVTAGVARHLDPDRLVVVVVGPADALAEELARLGPVTRDARAPEPLVERLFAALGGRERWRAARYLECELEYRPGAGELAVPLHTWRDLDRERLRVEQGGSPPVVLVLDGEHAWRRSGQNAEALPEATRAALGQAAWLDPHALLRQLAIGDANLVLETGARRFELVAGPAAGVWIELGDDGRPARIGTRLPEGPVVNELEGWRELDGILGPARIVRRGERGWTRTYLRLAVLPELDEELFARR